MIRVIILILAATSLLVASNTKYNYEITPIVGGVFPQENVAMDDSITYGLSLGFNRDEGCIFDQIELGYFGIKDVDYFGTTTQSDIHRIFINGIKDYEITSSFKLFALAGFGYEEISTHYYDTTEHDDKEYGFFNYGIGVKYAISEELYLKADVRHLVEFSKKDTLMYTVGLSIPFGKVTKNIPVSKPSTPKPVVIEEPKEIKPILVDLDNDEIFDDKDKSLNTKEIITIDQNTTVDSIDQSINTPVDAKVDSSGSQLDLDNDKVVDVLDKNNSVLLVEPEDLGMVFDGNSIVILSTNEEIFLKYANYLKEVADAKVLVEAHTDSIGGSEENLILSQKRANSAKKKLVLMGVESKRIKAIGHGEEQPLVDNDTEENREKNRRVTAKIVKKFIYKYNFYPMGLE